MRLRSKICSLFTFKIQFSLQNQISFQLKNNLEDSQFPQELVQSAVDTLFNVFDNMKKDLSPSEAKQNGTTRIVNDF